MRRNLVLASLLSISLVGIAHGQEGSNKATPNTSSAPAIVITPKSTPADLARAALQAQGGEKFRSLQNLTLRGSVQLYAPNSVQGIPGSFSITVAGDKLRMDLDGRPIVFFKQISDGQNTFSSMPGVEVPPVSKYGMGALLRYDQPGYKLTAIPDVKKQRGFRLEDPEGYTTDFYIDPQTGKIMKFLMYYRDYTFGTENNKFKEVEGVLVPSSFSQRFETPQGAFFAEYNVKEVKVNQALPEDTFVIPR